MKKLFIFRQKVSRDDHTKGKKCFLFSHFLKRYIPTKHSKQNALLGSFAALFFLASLDTSRYFRCSISLWLTELATVPLTGGLPDLLPREKTNMNMQRQMCCIYKQAYRHIWSQTEFIYCGHGWHQMMSVWMFVWVGRGGGHQTNPVGRAVFLNE